MIDITTFGAVGDGKTINTAAIQARWMKQQNPAVWFTFLPAFFLQGR